MFRFVVICGCLMAIAQAGIITGGVITGAPVAVNPIAYRAAGPTVALPALSAASSSNIVRGIGPLATVVGAPGLISGPGLITNIGAQALGIGINGLY